VGLERKIREAHGIWNVRLVGGLRIAGKVRKDDFLQLFFAGSAILVEKFVQGLEILRLPCGRSTHFQVNMCLGFRMKKTKEQENRRYRQFVHLRDQQGLKYKYNQKTGSMFADGCEFFIRK
jgi:hypothetical protein